MKKIIVANHLSLDGFVAGPNGEMDWIGIEDEMFDFVGTLTDNADAALYGRKTFQMMDFYWPTAGMKPDATKHDKEHSEWYNKITKYVFSNTMKGKDTDKTKFLSGDVNGRIKSLKQEGGKNIQIFGSPSVVQELMKDNLIDEYYLFVNPVLLGRGIPMFGEGENKINLKLLDSKNFKSCGVTSLHYIKAL